MDTPREFEIIVYGASGFTGRLVAEYLIEQYGVNNDLKWAIGGRNRLKLESLRQELNASNLPIVIADSQDSEALSAMTQRTKIVCTTVGPYAKFGSKLVAVCIETITDYCDLTGEVQWMRQMIDAHHNNAKDRGVRIVHTCGFDSIPSDMGVYYLQNMAKEKFGRYCQYIKLRVKAIKGGMSGGTVASLNNVLTEAAKDKSIFDILQNPYGLNPPGEQHGPDSSDLDKVMFDKDFYVWICPFIMSVINTKVVRRSHALAGYPYGKDFQYDEAMLTGSGFGGKLKGLIMTGLTGLVMGSKPDSLIKRIMNALLPKSGEGPSREKRETGFFNISMLGKLSDGSLIKGKVTGDKDPGYGSTSGMLGESAVCLAKDKDKTPKVGGILTPSVAMADVLLIRLQENAGLKFEIIS